MTNYLLLIRGGDEELAGYTPEQMQQEIRKYSQWARRLSEAGKLEAADKLVDDGGKTVRMRAGQYVVDGPFTEAKEAIGGFFVVKAENYEEAAAIAKDCPGLVRGAVVEVRQIENT